MPVAGYCRWMRGAMQCEVRNVLPEYLSRVPDVHHISISHDVVFAFQAESAAGAGVGFGASFEELVPADGFGADEVVFEIGVDGSSSLHCAGVYRDGPGAAFVFATG